MIKRQALLMAAVAAGLSMTAMAETAGTWTVGVGAGYVDPESSNGKVNVGGTDFSLDVDSDVRPTLTAEYFVADNVGIELLAALPFHHDIDLKAADGSVVKAKTQHLPPTLSLQYHFDDIHANVKPFIGVGANYTNFFKEKVYTGANNNLKIEDSWGVAGHVGLDFKINPTDAVRIDARYIDLEPDVKLDGDKVGKAEINPWVYGISYVQRF